jgi:hypothetical protein
MKNLLCLFLVLPLCLSAQTDTSGQHRLIKGLVDYRNELIARNPEGFKKLYLLDTLWKVEDKEYIQKFVWSTVLASKSNGMSAQKQCNLAHFAAKILNIDTFRYIGLINVEVLQTIIDNDEFSLLIGQSLYKQIPPFVLNPGNTIYEEFSVYKIRNGMKVAEVGSGDGTFPILLGMAYDSLEIYVNDIAPKAIDISWERIENCKSILPNNHYSMVGGTKKNTNFENVQLDKIIILPPFFKKETNACFHQKIAFARWRPVHR